MGGVTVKGSRRTGFKRLDGYVERIVEFADAVKAERAVTLCNAGDACGRCRRIPRRPDQEEGLGACAASSA
jgi:hypothetical protein